jgi:predicted anti-sigma-YlaC factor YlaD
MHAACDRARQWATADLDGELSRFEHVLLGAHLDGCPSCREFHTAIGGFTSVLRDTPPERLERVIEIRRARRQLGLRLAPAAAAMAVVAVVLGSSLVSSELRTNTASGPSAGLKVVGSHLAAVDTMNLSTARAIGKVATALPARVTSRPPGSLRGGPVVRER